MYITSDIRMEIEDCLVNNNRPMSATEIANKIGFSTQRTTAILKSMVYCGLIEKRVITKNNRNCIAYVHSDYEEEIIIDYEIANEKEEFCFTLEEFFDKVATFIEKSVDFLILYWYN